MGARREVTPFVNDGYVTIGYVCPECGKTVHKCLKWRVIYCEWDNGERTWGCVCSSCGAHIEHTRGCFLDYCPHCGARCIDDD